jgi:outer membrane protein TolC
VVEDPAVKWQAETARLRKKIQDLEDQERTLQLQVTQLTNQFFAPVSDQTSRDQAQAQLGETQSKLTAVRADLDQTKKTLDALQLQGPPAKK